MKVIDALGTATRFTWDKAGNKLTMTDGRGKITKYGYGSFGLLTSQTDAEGKETSYKYDLNLMIAYIKDRNGGETKYEYDNRGLLTKKRVLGTGDIIAYGYDELGNRETMTDATGTSTYEYNGNNWLIAVETGGRSQISYAYDDIGNITNIEDRLGNNTEYTYDKSGRMETVSFGGRTITYRYDENGNRASISYDGGAEESYAYDKSNRLLKLTNTKGGGSIISEYSYTYDKAGRQTSKEDGYGRTEYTYDKAGRVQKVETPGKTTVYAYDGAGNRISQDETYTSEQIVPAIDGAGISEIKYIIKRSEYIYGNNNKLLKLAEKMKDASGKELLQKITNFRYDGNGNELRRSVEYITLYSKENPKAYEAAVYGEDTTEPIHNVVDQTVSRYDGFNRLIGTEQIKASVRIAVEYAYDGDGLRVEKTVRRSDKGNTAEVTSYLYDRQHVILEERDSGDIRYVRGINYIGRIDGTDKLSYYLFNGHGDAVRTVSENGETENQYDYDIFGNPTLTIEEYENSIRYAGEFYDSQTGLYYLRARYYDPYIGRFISEDSYWGEDINPLSLNLYTYCTNDPIQHIDPSGHWQEGDEKLPVEAICQILKYTDDYNKAKAAGNKKGMDAAHASAEALREANKKNSSSSSSSNSSTSSNSSSGKSSGSSSSSKSGGSAKQNTPDYGLEAIKIMAKAQVQAALTGGESAQTFIDMINAQKLGYEAAKAGGKMGEAELYHQRAELLREELYGFEARNGRDISDIVRARGSDAGIWERYTFAVAYENAVKDGVIDGREATIIYNRAEEYNIAVQTGKNGIHNDSPDSDAKKQWESAKNSGTLIAMADNVVSDIGGLYLQQDNNVYKTLDDYLKANYSGKMTVTMLIQQPVVGERTVIDFNSDRSVGHTFIRIDVGEGVVIYRGFYPAQALDIKQIALKKDVESVLNIEGNALDSENNHPWDIAKVFEINSQQSKNILNFISKYNEKYNMVDNNCTTFAVNALKSGGINSSTIEHKWILPDDTKDIVIGGLPKLIPFKDQIAEKLINGLYGYTPADAGEDIRGETGIYLTQDKDGIRVFTNR